jgi:hypothetical protein
LRPASLLRPTRENVVAADGKIDHPIVRGPIYLSPLLSPACWRIPRRRRGWPHHSITSSAGRLQTRRQVWGLADDRLLLCRAVPMRSPTTTSPVATPTRVWRGGFDLIALTAPISSDPARTARSASSLWAWAPEAPEQPCLPLGPCGPRGPAPRYNGAARCR